MLFGSCKLRHDILIDPFFGLGSDDVYEELVGFESNCVDPIVDQGEEHFE